MLAWLSSGVLHNSSQRWPTVYPVLPPGVRKAKLHEQHFMLVGKGSVLGKGVFHIGFIFPKKGSGPVLEILQDEVNPRKGRSKLLVPFPVAKISLISMAPSGDRIRY